MACSHLRGSETSQKNYQNGKDPIAHTSRYICSVFKRLLELDTSQCMHAKQINYLKKKTAIWNRCTCTRVRVKNTKSLPFVNRHNASDRSPSIYKKNITQLQNSLVLSSTHLSLTWYAGKNIPSTASLSITQTSLIEYTAVVSPVIDFLICWYMCCNIWSN